MLKVRNLESGYGNLKVLHNISMHIKKGEIVSIIGANGVGKTTLLHTIVGLIPSMNGIIEFQGTNIRGIASEKIVFAGCSLVPEGRQIFSTLTVNENLIVGGYSLYKKQGKKEVEKQINFIYSFFPRLKERKDQLGGTLSGGEQQMLAIGRSLMAKPDLIMMDEPSMGLAPLIIKDIFDIIIELRKQNKTILLVEQNAKAALRIADRGYVMEAGTFVLEGPSDDLLNNNDVKRAYLGKDYVKIDE